MFNSIVYWIIVIVNTIDQTIQYYIYCDQLLNIRRQLILVPSILMILTYYTLYLILFDQMLNSRVPVSNSFKKKLGKIYFCFNPILDGNCVVKTIQTIGFIVIFGLITTNITFLILSMAHEVSQPNEIDLFDKMFIATFSVVSFWFLLSILVIYCRLSGQPFKSPQEYENTKYISIIFMLWTGAFIVKIVIYLIFNAGQGSEDKNFDFWYALFSILLSIVTDMVPYFSILELKFIEIFKNNATELWRRTTKFRKGRKNQEDNETEKNEDNEIQNNLLPRTPLISGGTEDNDNILQGMMAAGNQGDGSSGEGTSHITSHNQINNSVILAGNQRRSSNSIKASGTITAFREGSTEVRGSGIKQSANASDFFVISEQQLKMKMAIRRDTATPEQRNQISEQLLINKGNFQLLEVFSKAWYSNPKDKAKRLGILHKATIK